MLQGRYLRHFRRPKTGENGQFCCACRRPHVSLPMGSNGTIYEQLGIDFGFWISQNCQNLQLNGSTHLCQKLWTWAKTTASRWCRLVTNSSRTRTSVVTDRSLLMFRMVRFGFDGSAYVRGIGTSMSTLTTNRATNRERNKEGVLCLFCFCVFLFFCL